MDTTNTNHDFDYLLCVPCVIMRCTSVNDAEQALATLHALDGYRAGLVLALDGGQAALAYVQGGGGFNLPGAERYWLSGRAARALGLPNPLIREPEPPAHSPVTSPARHRSLVTDVEEDEAASADEVVAAPPATTVATSTKKATRKAAPAVQPSATLQLGFFDTPAPSGSAGQGELL